MPDIFAKDTTFKVIEYGSDQQGLETVEEIKNKITDFLYTVIRK